MSLTPEELINYVVTKDDHDEFRRLDQLLAARTEYSRTFLKHLFENELISSEDEKVSVELKKMPPIGTIVIIEVPPPLPSDLNPEKLPLHILYEDEYLVIVNKAAGMVTHPAPGNYTGTLVNAILHHCPDLKGIGDTKRPGIVHRLDKGTSGVMVVAKERKTHEELVIMFGKHDLERRYEAITMGSPSVNSGTITSTIGRHPTHRQKMAPNVSRGKKAITHFKVLERFEKCAHMELKLETGRTHQIRVHLSGIMHTPILLDPLYSNPNDHLKRFPPNIYELIAEYPFPFLHAKILAFKHPITGKDLYFETPPPPLFSELLSKLSQSK